MRTKEQILQMFRNKHNDTYEYIVTETKSDSEVGFSHNIFVSIVVSKKSQTQYAKYLINGLLSYLGLEYLFENVENPYLHLEQTSQEGSVRENFVDKLCAENTFSGKSVVK